MWEEVSIPGLDKVNTVIDNISTFGNYLLVGDNSGISVYNADDKSWENYTHKDGLLGDSNISFSSDGKELWLRFRSFTNGYTDGISKVDFIK